MAEAGDASLTENLWRVLPASNELIWWSQRDNWTHLYLYDLNSGRLKNRITTGDGNVDDILRVDEKARTIYFMGQGKEPGRDPYFQHLYRIGFDGVGQVLDRAGHPGLGFERGRAGGVAPGRLLRAGDAHARARDDLLDERVRQQVVPPVQLEHRLVKFQQPLVAQVVAVGEFGRSPKRGVSTSGNSNTAAVAAMANAAT